MVRSNNLERQFYFVKDRQRDFLRERAAKNKVDDLAGAVRTTTVTDGNTRTSITASRGCRRTAGGRGAGAASERRGVHAKVILTGVAVVIRVNGRLLVTSLTVARDMTRPGAWSLAHAVAGGVVSCFGELRGRCARPAPLPPSTRSTAPVMNSAADDARNRTAWAMSSG